MAKVYSDRIFTVIDVGTTKICVLVAQHNQENQIEIIGIGRAPSDGLRKGVVVDVGRTISSIRSAVLQAREQADHVGFPVLARQPQELVAHLVRSERVLRRSLEVLDPAGERAAVLERHRHRARQRAVGMDILVDRDGD